MRWRNRRREVYRTQKVGEERHGGDSETQGGRGEGRERGKGRGEEERRRGGELIREDYMSKGLQRQRTVAAHSYLIGGCQCLHVVQDLLQNSSKQPCHFVDQFGITSVETVVGVHCVNKPRYHTVGEQSDWSDTRLLNHHGR